MNEPKPAPEASDGRVRRIAFFGRLEERKGLRPFLAGVNALDPRLLEEVELQFIGRATPAWTPDRIEASLSDDAKRALRAVSFETDLDQDEALARLTRAGTLAVMPSFAETFGNTVRECLDYGIPFLASNAAAIDELVAPEDRGRALFEPTREGVEAALRRALGDGDALRPVRAAFDPADSLAAWEAVLATPPAGRTATAERPEPDVDVVIVQRSSPPSLVRSVQALARPPRRTSSSSTRTTSPPKSCWRPSSARRPHPAQTSSPAACACGARTARPRSTSSSASRGAWACSRTATAPLPSSAATCSTTWRPLGPSNATPTGRCWRG
jgi:hypothetical protein